MSVKYINKLKYICSKLDPFGFNVKLSDIKTLFAEYGKPEEQVKDIKITLENYEKVIADLAETNKKNPLVVVNLCNGLDEMDGWPGTCIPVALSRYNLAYTGADEKFYIMSKEKQPRRWHHMLIKTLETGISPMDTKRLEAIQNEFDKNQFLESIAHVPGVDKGVQLIEASWDGYFRSETDPVARKVWREDIIQKLEAAGVCIDGITPEVAYELSMRHLKAFGREGMMYNEFIEKYDLIKIRKDPDTGLWKAFVDRNAPLTWDPMRLIYCPKAMWIFFGFGSYMGGETASFKTLDGTMVKATAAQGVGADVLRVLLQEPGGLDFRIQDFYSRRKGFILDAWISEQLDKPGARPEDRAAWNAYIEELKNDKYDPATGRIARPADPVLASIYDEVQLKIIAAEQNIKFAAHFGTQVWERLDLDKEKILEKIKKFKKQAAGRLDLLATLSRMEGDIPDLITAAHAINIAIDPDWEKNPRFKDYFKSMANFHISEVPYLRLRRLQEVVRGNFRDTFNALRIYGAFGNFITDPTPANLVNIPVAEAKGYTSLADIQARMIVPAYNALVEVQRGFDLPFLRSKYGRVRDVASMDDRQLYKLRRELVTKEYLSKEMARKLAVVLRGPFKDVELIRKAVYMVKPEYLAWVGDKTLQYIDPFMFHVTFFAFVSKQLEQIMKEQEKG